jgi:ABC-type amino acid transport substrate-binding protein
MHIKQILTKLDLGNSVAEYDTSLEKYFVETETFRALVTNRVDIVAGDKGTGKTAVY